MIKRDPPAVLTVCRRVLLFRVWSKLLFFRIITSGFVRAFVFNKVFIHKLFEISFNGGITFPYVGFYGWLLYSWIILDNLKNILQHTLYRIIYRVIYRVIAFSMWSNRVLETDYKCYYFVPNLEFWSWQTIFFALFEDIGNTSSSRFHQATFEEHVCNLRINR